MVSRHYVKKITMPINQSIFIKELLPELWAIVLFDVLPTPLREKTYNNRLLNSATVIPHQSDGAEGTDDSSPNLVLYCLRRPKRPGHKKRLNVSHKYLQNSLGMDGKFEYYEYWIDQNET